MADLHEDFLREQYLRPSERELLRKASPKERELLVRLSRLRSWEWIGKSYLVEDGEMANFRLATMVANGLFIVATYGEVDLGNGEFLIDENGNTYFSGAYRLQHPGEYKRGGELLEKICYPTEEMAIAGHHRLLAKYELKSEVVKIR